MLGTALDDFETVRYTPESRSSLIALLARVGTTQWQDEEFAWWFDRNPGGEGIVSLAVDRGEVVGVAAMSFFTTMLRGVETRLAIPVNVATDARYRGQGVFSTLEQENEQAAAASGSPLTVTFPNAKSYPIFIRRLGWIDLPRLRLWARPLRASGVVRYVLGRAGDEGGMRPPDTAAREAHGLEVRAVERFGDGAGRARAALPPVTAATSPATPRTSTGGISTPRATTAASARIEEVTSSASASSATRSSTGSRRASSPTSSPRRRTARLFARSSRGQSAR